LPVARFVLRFFILVLAGAIALGSCLALVWPATRQVIFGTTAYGSVLPKVQTQPQRTVVYDRYGNPMDTLFLEDRSPVPLKAISPTLVNAVLSIEDHDFYQHSGVDPKALARAFFSNIGSGKVGQGGSTITQQLVKNTLIEHPKRDLQRKIQEAWLATRLEKELTKNQILEQYLNVIYFGNGAYGVRAATERYFGVEPNKVTLPQAALIAGLIQSPSDLDPFSNPDGARDRRSEVLAAMVKYGKATAAQAAAANRVPLPTARHDVLVHGTSDNSYFLSEVINQLLHDDPTKKGDVGEVLAQDYSSAYNAVFEGGLKIYTTYDPFLQNDALAAVRDKFAQLPQSPITAAMVVIDNSNGAVRAVVGGPNYQLSKYNLAVQGTRQTGSSFKGITLATALDEGYSPNDRVAGTPLVWPIPGSAPWNVHTDCSNKPITNLTDAIAASDNCAFARTVISLGPGHGGSDGAHKVIDMAGRLGIDTSTLDPVPSITLGTSPTSPLQMASAYSTFADNGMHYPPMFITKVVNSAGKVIYDDQGTGAQVITAQNAQTETQMLTGVITHGTASGSADIGRPAAGKTGTTDQHSDAWFIGYTPQLTAAVWMGYPDSERSMVPVLGHVFGGTYPAQMWAAFMKSALANQPALPFTQPDRFQWPAAQFIDVTGRSLKAFLALPPPTIAPAAPPPPANTPATTARPANKKPATTTPKKPAGGKPKHGGGKGP
jgi:penicillin-binding protein 1A